MTRSFLAAVIVTSLSCGGGNQDAATAIRSAQEALGASNLSSIHYSATAKDFGVGQSEKANGPSPHIFDLKVTRTFDFRRPAMVVTFEILPTSPLGPPPPPPPPPGGSAPPPNPEPIRILIDASAPWSDQLEIWTTPWGFLKGAADNQATVATQAIEGKRYQVLSWASPHKSPSGLAYSLNGYINDQNIIEKVETWLENSFFGDMHIETIFTDYKDFGGVKVPTRIVQQHAGSPRSDVMITTAIPNPPNIAQLMQAPPQRGGPPPGGPGFEMPQTRSEKLAEGVYRITGGYVALAVEFADHIVIIEGPENDARAMAIMAEARRVIPDKPIKYVVNTHHHDDHAGGLAAFAAEGVTIVTHENNKAFFDRVFSTPRTLAPDRLAASNRKVQIETAGDVKILKDATRVVELHHIKGLAHADGMLIAYLPKEKIIVQADMAFVGFPPPAGERRASTLVENLERLKLDYNTVVFVHAPEPDRRVTKADLLRIAAAELK